MIRARSILLRSRRATVAASNARRTIGQARQRARSVVRRGRLCLGSRSFWCWQVHLLDHLAKRTAELVAQNRQFGVLDGQAGGQTRARVVGCPPDERRVVDLGCQRFLKKEVLGWSSVLLTFDHSGWWFLSLH
jgi:hypothetical protein